MVSGFLNLGIVLLLAAGLVLAVRRLDREDRDGASGERSRWTDFAGRVIHPRAHHRR
jgi:hypothetical protein